MKINEIMIQEGVFDKLAAGVAGAKAGFQSGANEREGKRQQKETADEYIARWNSSVGQNPAINTPDNLKQFMHNSTRASKITVPEPPATLTPASAAQYITTVVGQALAASTIGSSDSDDVATGASVTQKTAPEKPTLTAGFAMVDDDPVTLKYKNQDFVRNDKGQWAPMLQPTKPIVDSAVAKVFDKQEQAIENWKAAQSGEPAAAADTPKTTAPPTTPAPSAPAAPTVDNRTIVDLRSPKGIRDTETEVFVRGHGIVQKQEDGSWRSLVSKAPVSEKDWPALDKMLAAAGTASADSDAPVSSLTPADNTSTESGAPVDSTASVGTGTVSVTFKKTDAGWINADPTKSSTVHKSGTKQYDALERHWAKLNKQPEPTPTVGTTPAAPATAAPEPAAAMTERFNRLSKITHGKI